MKQRLREKKRVGEFKELGFEVRADLRSDLADADIEAFVDPPIDGARHARSPSVAAVAATASSRASSHTLDATAPPGPSRARAGERRDAADERPRARSSSGGRSPEDQGHLHVRMHRECDRPPRGCSIRDEVQQ
jgi:hypothetical protein